MDFEQQLQLGADHLAAHDQIMAELVAQYGLPTFRPHQNYYQELVESIISQQLSVKAAATILGRFIDLFGHFPTPEEIAKRDFDELKSVGLSYAKTHYIRDLASRVIDGTISFENLDAMSNTQIIENLTEVKGIGIWTVHMFLIFAMGRLDVLASGDLGVRNALTKLYNFDYVVKDADIELLARSHHWHPYESLACWYGWQSLKNSPALS